MGFVPLLMFFQQSDLRAERLISRPLHISGNSSPQTLSLYQFQPNESEAGEKFVLYSVDYSELKHQLSIYKKIYVTGQIFHGALYYKGRSKYVLE